MRENSIDQELVTQVLNGDKEAFDVLVLKYQESICRLIGSIVRDSLVVMDLAQETFVSAYRNIEQFRGNSSFYTWLYRIAVNVSKNYLKSLSRKPPSFDIDFKDAVIKDKYRMQDWASPECILQRDEMQVAVLNAVNALPEDLRTSIVLREIAGLTYDEIAKLMNCPVGTVRSRIFRARVAVDEQIKPMLD